MIGYFTGAFEKYAVITGRARRAEYWYFTLTCFLLGVAIGFVTSFLGIFAGYSETVVKNMTDIVSGVFQLIILVPSITVGVRRLHDSNKSGWWLLLPFYNLYLLIRKGTTGPNFYGADPKAEEVVVPEEVTSSDTPTVE